MSNSIWVVVNAGGNSRAREVADEFNARACLELTEQRFKDQADILAEGPYCQAVRLQSGDRIAMLQGGGKQWRGKYGSGEFMACGVVKEVARPSTQGDQKRYSVQYALVRIYYPAHKPGNDLVGLIFYSLHRAKRLPKEAVSVRPILGDKFIEVRPEHRGYQRLNEWWIENCRGQGIAS